MSRLIIVSNRLPVSASRSEGRLELTRSVGGLATGLGSFYKNYQSSWLGWPGVTLEEITDSERSTLRASLQKESCYPVFLGEKDMEEYYFGFSNKTIWPLFHYFSQYATYQQQFWEAYKRVNAIFSDEIVRIAEPEDTIWIHDYQLMLLPQMVRERLPDASIGFFLHIPFPSFEIFRLLPWRREILEGLLGSDLVGFHTYDYVRHFLSSVRQLLGYDHTLSSMHIQNRVIKADAFPMGIDYQRFAGSGKRDDVKAEIRKMHERIGKRKVVISVDRLDYSKGIPQRLEAFDLFLEQHPEWRERVTLILVAVPSRTGIDNYMILKKEIDELVGRLNGKYATIGWIPVWYLYRSLPFPELTALYSLADVALITPLRDGMNLIAKEFIAAKNEGPGVLILSEMAGAVREMGETMVVNPNNTEEVVHALSRALGMREEEQIEVNRTIQKRLSRYNVTRWAEDFMGGLYKVKAMQRELAVRRLSRRSWQNLVEDYRKSSHRLILLDYDGTLTPFATRPEKAKPDHELSKILECLTGKKKNRLVVFSGRDRATLEVWLGNFSLDLIAEHGAWLKEYGKEWETLEPLADDWKGSIFPLLELFVDWTPGSFIEEKDFSLVWHYRKADPILAGVRVAELEDALLDLTSNYNLEILQGNRNLEIKHGSVHKGRGALRWITREDWDFFFAAGDDRTDEDVFIALPGGGYSIKVGLSSTQARFNLDSYRELRELLRDFAKADEC